MTVVLKKTMCLRATKSTISLLAFSTDSLLDSSLSVGPVDGQWWTSDVGSLVIHGTLGAALSRRWKALATVFFSASLRSPKTDALLIQALVLLQGRVYNYDNPSGSFHGFSFQSPRLRPGVLVVWSHVNVGLGLRERNEFFSLVRRGTKKLRGLLLLIYEYF